MANAKPSSPAKKEKAEDDDKKLTLKVGEKVRVEDGRKFIEKEVESNGTTRTVRTFIDQKPA